MDTKKNYYINYKKYSLNYNIETNTFDVMIDGYGKVIKNARMVSITDMKGLKKTFKDFGKPVITVGGSARMFGAEDVASMTVMYPSIENGRDFGFVFELSDEGIRYDLNSDLSADAELAGEFCFGDHDQKETMSVCLNRMGSDIRSASGPATSADDNALFDPDRNAALTLDTKGDLRIKFDWKKGVYTFTQKTVWKTYTCAMTIKVVEHVYEDIMCFDYKKANKDTTFKVPPVGWMTWYAVQFDAGEKTVLENAEFQKKYLQKYGADTVWVDWEWYHRDFSGIGDSDVDMFHPDPITYPNGLKHVAEKIEELGFIPALWVGPTNDPTLNEVMQENPDSIILQKPAWCGQYWYDVTHPAFLEKSLPKMLMQPVEWGYKAIKWDVMPNTLSVCTDLNDKLYEKGISARGAMLKAYQKARSVLGKDYYMLYCCATSQRDIDLAVKEFDGVRIGGDIFRWDEFLSQLVDKLYKYYSLHNVVIVDDPDNVVIRDKFNNMDQAITRAAIVSLCGLPFTFGDNLPDLQEERVEILRRSIPPIPFARPMDIRTVHGNGREMKINLAVERPFASWNVVDVVNLSEEEAVIDVDIRKDLHLDTDGNSYIVYDYWTKKYIGEFKDSFSVKLNGCASSILSVVKREEKPQVISTSRHISHGAIDLIDVKWTPETRELSGKSKVVGGEPYSIIVSTNKSNITPVNYSNHTTTNEVEGIGGDLYRVTYHPEQDGEFDWSIGFVPGVASED